MNDMEITDLNTQMLSPWDGVEAPVTMFTRAVKYECQLERFGILKQPEIRLSYTALFKQAANLTQQCANEMLVL